MLTFLKAHPLTTFSCIVLMFGLWKFPRTREVDLSKEPTVPGTNYIYFPKPVDLRKGDYLQVKFSNGRELISRLPIGVTVNGVVISEPFPFQIIARDPETGTSREFVTSDAEPSENKDK